MIKKCLKIFVFLTLLIAAVYFIFLRERYPLNAVTHSFTIGDSVDSFNGIVVYNNGMDYSKSHGKHYTQDSVYYYGKKWQCVEYIKRYYYDHLNHKMPNGFGNAKDFFDGNLTDGELNKDRGLLQFRNGSALPPELDDILVFGGKFGHVAIITKVTEKEIEVIQQNIYMTPRDRLKLKNDKGKWIVGENRKPEGWLRRR